MRHGLGYTHGYFMGYGGVSSVILWVGLAVALLALIALLVEHFRKKKHPGHNTLMKILEEKYYKHEISADEYRERSMILEDEYWLDPHDPEMVILKERYAKCEIDSREYVKRRDELKERSDRFSSASFKEGPAR
jgi:uncharacterized membrane protein